MKDSTFMRNITFVLIFLSFYAISILLYLVFFNEPAIDPNTILLNGSTANYYGIYSDRNIVDVLFVNALICFFPSFIIMVIYQQRILKKSRVITEEAVIIDKDISVYMASPVNKGGGGQIRKDLVVKFKLGDDTEVDLTVDEEHYVSAINGERVKLSYKNCYDLYIFIDFEIIDHEKCNKSGATDFLSK